MKSPDGILERPSPKSASFKRKMLIALCILLTTATIASLAACGKKKKRCAKCGRSEDETELFLFSTEDHPGADNKYYCSMCYRIVFSETPVPTVASEIAAQMAEDDAEKPRKLVASFFEAFETGNFSTMKSYCSMNCKSKYFHDDDVYGMRKVKVKEYGEEEFYSDKFGTDFYSVYVTADVELASGKSTTKSFTIILLQDVGGNWSVHEFSDEEK